MTRNLIFALCLCLFAACSGCGSARNPEADKIAIKKVLLQMDDAMRKQDDTIEARIKQARPALKKIDVRSCPEDFRADFEELRSVIIKQMELSLKYGEEVPDGKKEELKRLGKRGSDASERLTTIAKLYDMKWEFGNPSNML